MTTGGKKQAYDIPEPFRSALKQGCPEQVADCEARGSEDLRARGLVRIRLGRDADARADMQQAQVDLGDMCAIELVYLDLRANRELESCPERARAIADAEDCPASLRVRALHVEGHAWGKLRQTGRALDCLLDALKISRDLGFDDQNAQVQDTLGMVFAAQGQLEQALGCYALSLVGKTLTQDRYGMAITLGNLGRVHLRAGRFGQALECFHLDLKIAEDLSDRRGQARMHNDLGRTLLGQKDLQAAELELRQCLQIARAQGYVDISFFAHKDLALTLLAKGQLEACEQELAQAEAALASFGAPLARSIFLAVRGQWKLAAGVQGARGEMEQAVDGFQAADTPDFEIPALLTLAEAHLKEGATKNADGCLQRALARARRDGFARYLPDIRECMGRLATTEPMEQDESGRLQSVEEGSSTPDGYTIIRLLGGGGFGRVYKAYDTRHGRTVAIKVMQPRPQEGLDGESLRRMTDSARMELLSASRIRHPGVARVYAMGHDAQHRPYVVQEFIAGQSLRDHLRGHGFLPLIPALNLLRDLAHAVQELHEHGVLHRDLKPGNIMLRDSGQLSDPVLVDFGLAHLEGDQQGRRPALMGGTRGYMAPEQMLMQAPDQKADIYALGAILCELLTGDRLASLAEDPRGFPEDVIALSQDMLADDPHQRPGAGEVITMCKNLLLRPGSMVCSHEDPSTTTGPGASGSWWLEADSQP